MTLIIILNSTELPPIVSSDPIQTCNMQKSGEKGEHEPKARKAGDYPSFLSKKHA